MEMIRVSEPFIPNKKDFSEVLDDIWKNKTFTNSGPILRRFESELKNKLNLPNCAVVANGTVALEICIKALKLKGEIVTPAFSWIATHAAIVNSNCMPKYCDIDHRTLNIDIDSLKKSISEETVGILPVHVFGNPVNVEAVEKVANEFNLKVIYDAAHAFGSEVNDKSVFKFGDASSSSFHATKVVNSAEGGMCISEDGDLANCINQIRFYGFDDSKNILRDGTNAKMSELNAALGICSLKHSKYILEKRAEISNIYRENIHKNSNINFQEISYGKSNLSYFPLILGSEEETLSIMKHLLKCKIETRRYFYPSLSKLDIYPNNFYTPVSDDISKRIICIPNHPNLSKDEAFYISESINKFYNL